MSFGWPTSPSILLHLSNDLYLLAWKNCSTFEIINIIPLSRNIFYVAQMLNLEQYILWKNCLHPHRTVVSVKNDVKTKLKKKRKTKCYFSHKILSILFVTDTIHTNIVWNIFSLFLLLTQLFHFKILWKWMKVSFRI
jgi:hypothetical protein